MSYDEPRHQEALDQLKNSNGSIEAAIHRLVELYKELYVVNASSINYGLCEMFGGDLEYLFPEAVGGWGDEFTEEEDDHEVFGYHYIVKYQGRYYDSEHPRGLEDFRDMSTFYNPR